MTTAGAPVDSRVSDAVLALGPEDRSPVLLYALGWLENAEANGRPADWREAFSAALADAERTR